MELDELPKNFSYHDMNKKESQQIILRQIEISKI